MVQERADWMRPDPDHPLDHADLRTDRAHPARVYDYMLGGKDNFDPDRETACQVLRDWPEARVSMRANRACMRRITRRLAAEHGIDQFLDIGTGLPTSPNLHEVAQAENPAARVVYVDNDPIVLAHARALLSSGPAGRTAYLDGDFLDPDGILTAPELTGTLDLTRPVGLTLVALLHFFTDAQARPALDRLVDALPSGSFLALTTATADTLPDEIGRVSDRYRSGGIDGAVRTRTEVEALFDGLDLIEPGVALIHRWDPDGEAAALRDDQIAMYAGVARKP